MRGRLLGDESLSVAPAGAPEGFGELVCTYNEFVTRQKLNVGYARVINYGAYVLLLFLAPRDRCVLQPVGPG